MCGRYVYDDTENIEKRFGIYASNKPQSNWNAAPTQTMPVIRQGNHGPLLDEMRWGLIPVWAKDMKIGYKLFNTRSETIFEKPSWRNAIKSRRCLIPASGFYEWKHEGKTKKQPYYIQVKDEKLFAFAGIWETWKDKKSGEDIHSYSIITTEPNKEMSSLHDRMPVILHPEDESAWMSEDADQGLIESLMVPYGNDRLQLLEVSKDVNIVKNNDGHLILPINSK